jgi:methionine biosynthesis protein MetW
MFYFNGTRKPDFSSISNLDYDNYWKDRGFSINKSLKEREQIILKEIPPGSTVLDLGAGNSKLPIALKEKGCEVIVGDISDEVLKGFLKHNISTFHINLEEVTKMKFDRNFDYIILSEVLEHIRNPEEILLSLKPYTKYFFLTIPNSAFYRYRFHLMFRGRFFTQWVYHPSEHLRFWSHIDFLEWLRALDLNVIYSKSSNGLSLFKIPLYQWMPNLFGHQICYVADTAKKE